MAETAHQNHHPSQGKQHDRKRRNNWESRNGKSRTRFRGGEFKKAASRAAAVAPQLPMCSVCNQVESPKYKCPKCRDSYCSIQCCRTHKENGCSPMDSINSNPTPSDDPKTTNPTSKYLPQQELAKRAKIPLHQANPAQESTDEDQEEGWRMTESMTKKMESSEWLKNELQDVGLRHLISGVVAVPDTAARKNSTITKQGEELDQAMIDNPRFKRFVDKLLVVTGVLERHGRDGPNQETNGLDDWLRSEAEDTTTRLVLKPIERKTRNAPEHLTNSKEATKAKSKDQGGDKDSESNSDSSSSSVASSSSEDSASSSDEE